MSSLGKWVEHFSSTPFQNAGFLDGILKYAFRVRSVKKFWSSNGTKHTHGQSVYGSVSSNNVYSTLTTSRDQVSIWVYEPLLCVYVCVFVSTRDTTRQSESVSSLHSPSPWWLTAELIPRLTPSQDWLARSCVCVCVHIHKQSFQRPQTLREMVARQIHTQKQRFMF